jgi:single-strand DNA-binding protein
MIDACFTGRLGGDPEARTSQAGKPWARFGVAIGHGDDVQWVSVACWGELAERVCEQFSKGDRCYVEGTIRLNEWQDREGLPRHGLQCAAYHITRMAPRANKPKSKGIAAAQRYDRPLDERLAP